MTKKKSTPVESDAALEASRVEFIAADKARRAESIEMGLGKLTPEEQDTYRAAVA